MGYSRRAKRDGIGRDVTRWELRVFAQSQTMEEEEEEDIRLEDMDNHCD